MSRKVARDFVRDMPAPPTHGTGLAEARWDRRQLGAAGRMRAPVGGPGSGWRSRSRPAGAPRVAAAPGPRRQDASAILPRPRGQPTRRAGSGLERRARGRHQRAAVVRSGSANPRRRRPSAPCDPPWHAAAVHMARPSRAWLWRRHGHWQRAPGTVLPSELRRPAATPGPGPASAACWHLRDAHAEALTKHDERRPT
jgi:hypothetical protein